MFFALCVLTFFLTPSLLQPPVPVVRRYPAPEARQAVAVDDEHFYAITSAAIGKYDKRTGERVAEWREAPDGRIVHLNSGIVLNGELYCATSNYPQTPMSSSIEVFDTASLSHVRTIALPDGFGSATWIDRRDGQWWIAFAHYAGQGGIPGIGPEGTMLVRFDGSWEPQEAWTCPAEVVARWDGMSSSGGVWGPDGLLYTTGHHTPELYVLELPAEGSELVLREILTVESEGQGIAVDGKERLLYGIQRRTGEVLVSRLPAPVSDAH